MLELGKGYHLMECEPVELHHSIRFLEDRVRLVEEIAQMQAEPKQFALIQSTLKIPFEQIANVLDLIVEAQRTPMRRSA